MVSPFIEQIQLCTYSCFEQNTSYTLKLTLSEQNTNSPVHSPPLSTETQSMVVSAAVQTREVETNKRIRNMSITMILL